MKVTDKRVSRWLNQIADEGLYEMVETYPENELDGRNEIELFTDELSYAISCYEEDGHCWKEDLDWAKEILRETKYGKVIPLVWSTLKPKYRPSEIESAKCVRNTYYRMKYRYKELNKIGYYGKWL